jgi:ArsR family transcriptional regulator, arsenate/arsenite/antimonite-responsive transcriptional repressor
MVTKALSLAFQAMSDSNRRKIIQLLKNKDMTAGGIASHFPISKPSLSHHFSILKQANLVTTTRKGQKIYYSLNTTVFYSLVNNFLEIFGGHDEIQP